MQIQIFRRAPVLIAGAVLLSVCFVRWRQWGFFEGLERATFDIRARQAARAKPPVATNLGFVAIDEDSLKAVWNGSLGMRAGLLWPRSVYGRLIAELSAQGAEAVALDIILKELRPDHPPVEMAAGGPKESDEFFAMQLQRASNVIIAVSERKPPPSLFLTNAWAAGDITTEKDADGILRRVRIVSYYRRWHPIFLAGESNPDIGLDLDRAIVEPNQIRIPKGVGEEATVPLDEDGCFDQGEGLPPGTPRKAKPFTIERVWHMGVVLAAHHLGLDLNQAEVDLAHGHIRLRGRGGVVRDIPVDAEGFGYVDWCMLPNHPALEQESIQSLLLQYKHRLEGHLEGLTNRWLGKLVVVGSSALVGNNLTDRGATPLERDTLLVSKHWNVANSVLTGRFVQRSSLVLDFALIALVGLAGAALTRYLRVPLALSSTGVLAFAYIFFGAGLYVLTRFWIPLVLPLVGLVTMALCIIAWRVMFEQAERRRVKSIFSEIVSPKVMEVLLEAPQLKLGGTRCEVTVLFADVRGFTEFTDRTQEEASEFVRKNKLEGAAAEACYDNHASETLSTVNLYLGLVADTILRQDATLDKFIGDCVMAFWGSPTPNPQHALSCVRAAIEAQRAVYAENQKRSTDNKKLELENLARLAAGLPPKPMKPLLLLGSGINTGVATVGLMGTQKQKNYTVFGREVNLASRLEGLSGRGRIFISESTFLHIQRDDPALAATCVAQPPAKVKGISAPVKVYEVPWRPPGSPPFDEEFATSSPTDSTTFTGLLPRPG